MKCQICSQAEAIVHIKEVRDDRVNELHLCEKCAREKGFHSMLDQGKASLANQFIWMAENLYPDATAKVGHIQCATCGLTYSDFVQSGRLGCPDCYTHFGPQLKQILRRVHGSVRHVGRAPGKDGEVFERRQKAQRLHEELERAVEREEYERAAVLRDQIRLLEESAAGSPPLSPPPERVDERACGDAGGDA